MRQRKDHATGCPGPPLKWHHPHLDNEAKILRRQPKETLKHVLTTDAWISQVHTSPCLLTTLIRVVRSEEVMNIRSLLV